MNSKQNAPTGSQERHPLDQDDDDMVFGAPDRSVVPEVNRPLQTFSVYLLIATAVLLVMSGAIAANSAPTSPTGLWAYGLNRFFMFVLLVAFGLLLIAYRWNKTKEWVANAMTSNEGDFSPSVTPQVLDSFGAPYPIYGATNQNHAAPVIASEGRADHHEPAAGLASHSYTTSSHTKAGVYRPNVSSLETGATERRDGPIPTSTITLSALYAFSLTAAVAITLLLFLIPDFLFPFLLYPLSTLMMLSLGLWITIAVWHTGLMRAYAIGMAAGLVLFANQGMYAFALFGGGIGMGGLGVGGMNRWSIGMSLAIPCGLFLLSGLMCATYVHLLTQYRSRSRVPRPPQSY